jgi:hypothetical protein
MDITTLENPHSTEMSVMEEGRANFERCANLELRMGLLRFSIRLAFFSSRLSFRFMTRPSRCVSLMIVKGTRNAHANS